MDNIVAKYKAKAQDSFKTKLTLYLFDQAINNVFGTINQSDFDSYQINQDIVDIYTTVYWQRETHKTINGITIKDIEQSLTEWRDKNKTLIDQFRQHYVNDIFPILFPETDFAKLLQGETCKYCGVTIAVIEQLADKGQIRKKSLRGWVLEIDRLDSNFEYTKNNCVMACYWCNNAKTDEFTEIEFKKIGKCIAGIWENRMA